MYRGKRFKFNNRQCMCIYIIIHEPKKYDNCQVGLPRRPLRIKTHIIGTYNLYCRNSIRVRAVCTEIHWIYGYKRNNIKTIFLRDRLGKDTMGNPRIISQKDFYANEYYIRRTYYLPICLVLSAPSKLLCNIPLYR